MNRITQYRPAFFEGFENESKDFETLLDLMEMPFVKRFSDDPTFFQFVVSGESLMATYDKGAFWLVVGELQDSDIGLPKWDGGNIR